MIKNAIVILNWNGIELLKQFLPSVIEHSKLPDTSIFIIDNYSADTSVGFIKQNYPDIEIIELDNNYGFAGGYNRGLMQIEAQNYILINSDIEVQENWLNPVLEVLDSDSNIAACMPKIKAYRNKAYFEHAGAAGGFIDKYGYPLCKGRIFNSIEMDNGQYQKTEEIFWATGACLFIKADLFKSFGGFDEMFFAHMEEIDLCWRLKNQGYSIMYVPESEIFHVGGATLDYMDPRKTYLNFRNSLFMLYKNLSPKRLYRVFIIRMILDGVAALKFLIGLEFGNFISVFKAHLSFYSKIIRLSKKRRALLKVNTNYDHPQIIWKSIVYQFFVKKKKFFSEL
jgi:GT2 family glycosyltransferase